MAHRFPLYAVIMAGGSGKRLWPLSRRGLPKQFLRCGGGRSLLRETFERVLPLSGLERVIVVVGREHVTLVRDELPELPEASALLEPVGRDTAACVGLAAEWITAREAAEDSLMVVCPADHKVEPADAFQDAVRDAAAVAARANDLVTFGISPRGPSTAFGYIERGAPLASEGPVRAFRVRRFAEKPDRARAEGFLRAGGHYWNAGIFVWRTTAIRAAIARHFPDLAAGLAPLGRLLRDGAAVDRVLGERYPGLAKNSIDRGVLEKAAAAGEVAVVEAPFAWDDVGSFDALERYLPSDGKGNHVEGLHRGLDTEGCIIAGSGRRLIATIGLRDLVVAETDDAILICRRDQAEKVKDLVEGMESERLGSERGARWT